MRERLHARRSELLVRRIVVLAGGSSSEREVSLRSGAAVADALSSAGYQASLLGVAADGLFFESGLSTGNLPLATAARDAAGAVETRSLELQSIVYPQIRQSDLVFTTLHGASGENGAWQGLLELLNIPFVSAGVKGSALAMDKLVTKRLFVQMGIPTPQWWIHTPDRDARRRVPVELQSLVAKPVSEGSSVGVQFFSNDDAGWTRVEEQLKDFPQLLVEERIRGTELTAAVIGPASDPTALPLVEIRPGAEFYDYSSKYTAGGSSYNCPALVDELHTRQIQTYATHVYQEFDLAPYARLDCILDADGLPWFLEANTLPGFTPHSMVPMAARAAGIEIGELTELLLLCAVEQWEHRNRTTGVPA